MKKFLNKISPNTIFVVVVGLVILLQYSRISNLFSFIKSEPKSDDNEVNNAIDIIDSSFRKFGTFNKHHEPIFEMLENLNSQKIRKLHKDFGTRYYNPITRIYALTNIGNIGISEPLGLNALYYAEFDETQIERLKRIYFDKGVNFPFTS